ncbi:MAG TPA: DUF3307 domain-containing protein [Roseiflexaceae bacterium]|nr:DUF3307 domain-containing protein [Roseiflexaceae bacterium]
MFYLFLLAHLVADFMLQPYWLVVRKRHLYGLAIHCGVVLACMLALPLLDPATAALWPAMLAITAVHFATDWGKVQHGGRIPGPPIGPFLLDQVVHVATLAVALSLWLPPDQVWRLSGSPAAVPAVYAGAYIVALLAAPIGVMVWLDPAFDQVALAGRARIRSLVAGAAVVSLALFGGAVALPAALLGLVVVARRPVSPHPLDSTAGMLAVMSVAAALGTLLQIAL